jgi:hypothetical protein
MKHFALALLALAGLMVGRANAGPVGYDFGGLAFYIFGAPADVLAGSPTGEPDTSFVRITNNGASTFTGTIGFNAISGFGVDFSNSFAVTLNPGDHVSIAINAEASNLAGYGGPFGSVQTGAQYEMKGVVSLGINSEPVDLTIFDMDIHSGVFQTNPFGLTLDSYILQGGDPIGRDTGDAFEVSQAAGPFRFFQPSSVVPEPASLTLIGFGIAGLAGYAWRKRKQLA